MGEICVIFVTKYYTTGGFHSIAGKDNSVLAQNKWAFQFNLLNLNCEMSF